MDTNKLDEILRNKYTPNIPNVKVGDTVKIVLKLKEKTKNKDKNKTQIIQGVVISHKHGKELGANITIRRILDGVGVEWTIPVYSSNIASFDIIKSPRVKKSKLYYIRNKSVRETKAALKKEYQTKYKQQDITPATPTEQTTEKSEQQA